MFFLEDDFYSALAQTEVFNSAKPNGDVPNSESGSATEIDFGAGGFVGFMQEDFKKQLVSDSDDDPTGKIICNAMSYKCCRLETQRWLKFIVFGQLI